MLMVEKILVFWKIWSTTVTKTTYFLVWSLLFRRRESMLWHKKYLAMTLLTDMKRAKLEEWSVMHYRTWSLKIESWSSLIFWLKFVWMVMLSITETYSLWPNKWSNYYFLKDWSKFFLRLKHLLWVSTCPQRQLFSTQSKKLQAHRVPLDFWTVHNMCRCLVERAEEV